MWIFFHIISKIMEFMMEIEIKIKYGLNLIPKEWRMFYSVISMRNRESNSRL